MKILSAMNHAHKAKVIHRDLKPQNIMISDDGVVKITDFGLAKDRTVVSNTMTITSGGTLYYMSPEHVQGFQFIDYRSDIYSIGMILYEMLTGIVPFTDINSDFDIREMIMRKDFEKPSKYNNEIPIELESIVMKSIAKKPEDRYKKIEDMLQAVLKLDVHEEGEVLANLNENLSTVSEDVTELAPKQKPEYEESFETEETDKKPKGIFKFALFGIMAMIVFLFLFYNSDYFFSGTGEIEKVNISSILSVSTSPEPASVFLGNDSIGKTPVTGYSILPGEYYLSIKNNRYQTIDTSITVKQQSNLSLSFTLLEAAIAEEIKTTKKEPANVPAKPGSQKPNLITQSTKSAAKSNRDIAVSSTLSIKSTPTDAIVWLDNKRMGKTPINLKSLKSGNYELRLEKNAFRDYFERLYLSRNRTRTVNANLVKLTGKLYLTSNQKDIRIFIDDKVKDYKTIPAKFDKLPAGKHTVKIWKNGYSVFEKEVDIKPGETVSVNASLERLSGDLSILIKPWGSVSINGEQKATSTDRKYSATLPQDNYSVKIEHPTLGVWEKQVEIKAGYPTNITVNFNKKIEVNVKSIDGNGNSVSGEILVGKNETGIHTPGVVSLTTGIHYVQVVAEGYTSITEERKILIDENLNTPLVFTLKKN